MDFTPELSSFQGVLISADNVYSFSKLTAKGGNEDKIKYLIGVIRNFLLKQNFIGPNGLVENTVPVVRKFTLYMVLNADFLALEEMVQIEGIDTVIWTIPTIPQCLLCEFIWNLHLEKFLYEAILFINPVLGLQLVDAFINNFKYFQPTDAINKLRPFIKACYIQICRLHLLHIDKSHLLNLLSAAFNNFQNILKFYTEPPNVQNLNSLSKDSLYKYKGQSFRQFLLSAIDCFEQFTHKPEFNSDGSQDIYYCTFKENSIIKGSYNFNTCDSNNKDIIKCLTDCNEIILDICKVLVMDVSVDIFCAWSEFEENGRSMQQIIGELCYKLMDKISEIPVFLEHPVISMIRQIARKPVNIKDIINVIDSDTIVENINKNDEDKDAWLHALLDRNDLCHNTNLLKIIESNLHKFDPENSYALYKIIQTHLNSYSENHDEIKLIAVKVFQQCNLSDQYKILDETFGDKCFTNVNETTEFNNMMTEIFNKLVASPEADVDDILAVFLQNPYEVYTKICTLATENSHQADIMIKVSLLLQNYCNHYYRDEIEPCVVKSTRKMLEDNLNTENKQSNGIKFACGLRSNIIPGNKLLLLVIMPNMHKALINRNIINAHVQVKLLKEAYSVDELIVYRAPMLAMLAQVLDVVRWKVDTFTPTSPNALEDTLKLQMSIIETYGEIVPEKEKIWLKNKMITMHPLNMYYYRILWKPPGKNFLEVISGKTINPDTSLNEITSWLTQLMCSISQQEWCYIWDSLEHLQSTVILKIFHDALSIETLAEAANRTDTSWMCIYYCYKCFFFVTKNKFFREPLTARQVSAFANRISATAKLIKKENSEEIGNILLPLIAYLSEKKQDHKMDLVNCLGESLRSTPLEFVIKLVCPDAKV